MIHTVFIHMMDLFGPPDKSVLLKNIFLISQSKHMLWVPKRTLSMRRFFGPNGHPKHMFKLMGKKIIRILCLKSFLIWTYAIWILKLHQVRSQDSIHKSKTSRIYAIVWSNI